MGLEQCNVGTELEYFFFFFFSSRRRHTSYWRDWSSDVCSSDLEYDLICFFDCLHDMGRPIDAARHAADAMAADGTLMLVEPFAGDRVEDNVNPIGRLYYAASTTLCCAHAISEKGTHVLGAQAGPRQLEEALRSAGLGSVRLAAQTPFNLIIEARH